MATQGLNNTSSPVWFVGASYGGTDDQTARFLAEGIWENGYDDKFLDTVCSMRPGERIAIKASYVRKHGLPFDGRGFSVSAMAIKAVGTITENLNDGKRLKVEWTKVEPTREWYFFTHRGTIWKVLPGEWMRDGLIAFAFDGKPQDIDRFRNAPYWRERFGSHSPSKARFRWTKFYEAMADKLLAFRHDRASLVAGIQKIAERMEAAGHLAFDKYADGTSGFVRDICPFTTMGMFNRGITDANRKSIAAELAAFLGVEEPVPETFEGVPFLSNLNSWYYPYEVDRAADHIDSLWDVFAAGIALADSESDVSRAEFSSAFDAANWRQNVGWKLTFGLFWIRPWAFLSLDGGSRQYVTKKLGVTIGLNGPKKRCSAADYLALMDVLEPRFQEPSYPVHSYPELSHEAWSYKDPTQIAPAHVADSEDEADDSAAEPLASAPAPAPVTSPSYTIDDLLQEGCFLEREEIARLLERLRTKKNLILQGPPGTGKTWLAKRLAYALMGEKNEGRVRAVQFHPNLSYEDFVRGWRPTGEGKLSLADGVFMEAIKAASAESAATFVVVIEEINRGNPAQVFGELLTLLEAGKRTPSEAIELCYPDADGVRRPVHVPENLHVVGTMNIADRSLALVDLALRRRFAFINLEPRLGSAWRKWVVEACAVDSALALDIEHRLVELNEQIAADPRLGKQFRIGHSYVTPAYRLEEGETRRWFQQVVETEIGPLLDEYWFDAPEEAQKATARLLQGW